MQDGIRDHRRRSPGECRTPRHHFVENKTECEEIRAKIEGFSAHVLGRHVADCAHLRGGGRWVRRWGQSFSVIRCGCPSGLRQAEIQNLRVTPGSHKDVRWLDVPVNDAGSMRHGEGIANLPGDAQGFRNRQGPVAEAMFQVCPSSNSITMK